MKLKCTNVILDLIVSGLCIASAVLNLLNGSTVIAMLYIASSMLMLIAALLWILSINKSRPKKSRKIK